MKAKWETLEPDETKIKIWRKRKLQSVLLSGGRKERREDSSID
jgi:hypothetical protein